MPPPRRWGPMRRWGPILLGSIWYIGIPLQGLLAGGATGLEKTMTAMVMPLAFAWNLLLLLALWQWFRGNLRSATAFAIPVLLLGILGNGHFGGWLCWLVESPRPELQVEQEAVFDAIVLLGGSTRMADETMPELGSDGQRLLFAAQLYQQAATPRIIATGGGVVFGEAALPFSTQSRLLLESVGVPAEAIIEVGGINTREEMQHLRRWFDEHSPDTPMRVGLITNAAHLPRALRLAERHGLSFVPLACAHRGGFGDWTPTTLIPSDHALQRTAVAWYEILARLAGQ